MDTYEDAFGAVGRRAQRLGRAVKWRLKRFVGAPRRILVELRWRLGDEIMALPVFESLRAKYPSDRIAVLSNYPELFENHPFVDAVNEPPAPVDRYILLRGAPRHIFRIEHYCRQARAPMPVSRPHLYYQDWSAPQLEALPKGEAPIIAVAAGATWPTKRWRMERWRTLCHTLQESGARVVELGKGVEPVGVGLCLVDKTTIHEAACVLHRAGLLVCCDSGLMHLALAANTPVVALFGPTDPNILIRNESNFYPIQSTQECRSYWNTALETPDPNVCPWKHECCLDTVSVEDVLKTIERRLTLR